MLTADSLKKMVILLLFQSTAYNYDTDNFLNLLNKILTQLSSFIYIFIIGDIKINNLDANCNFDIWNYYRSMVLSPLTTQELEIRDKS